jgi:hypothetical protein
MKTSILYGLVLLLCLQGVGCTSMHVIEKAHGTPPQRDDAKPAYYLLLPLSVPLDVALVTVGGLFFLYAKSESDSDDDYSSVSSSDSSEEKGGLKVSRPQK